jgi:hypothetical protein
MMKFGKCPLAAVWIITAVLGCGATAADYFVNAVTGNDGNAGASVKTAFKTLKKAHDKSNPGDTIRVMAGSFNERVVFTRGGTAAQPVIWRTYGDGDVLWTYDGAVQEYTGAMLYADANTGPSHVVFEGSPGSSWVFHGARKGGGAICVYGNTQGTRTVGWRFSHIVIRDNKTRGSTIAAWQFVLEDSDIIGNRHGIMFLPSDGNRDAVTRPWSGLVIRRNRFFNNDSGRGNVDGITIQDLDGVLIEENEVSGQYDGIDCGSLPGATATAPGPRWIIVRNNRVTGRNGCTPCSTVRQGPLFIGYNAIYDNKNWGATPVYEESGNVHIWNNTYVNNMRAVNFIAPTGSIHFFNNLVVGTASGKAVALDANRNSRFLGYNYLAGAVHANPSEPASTDQHGTVNSVTFADKSRFYPITASDAALIDRGTFFLRTAAVANSVIIPVVASYKEGPSDPRVFFWPGDKIQIAGVGLRRIVSLSASSITVDLPVTVAAGTGVHYPYSGAAPDIGRAEFTRRE